MNRENAEMKAHFLGETEVISFEIIRLSPTCYMALAERVAWQPDGCSDPNAVSDERGSRTNNALGRLAATLSTACQCCGTEKKVCVAWQHPRTVFRELTFSLQFCIKIRSMNIFLV